jgi:general secretion pathway protein L
MKPLQIARLTFWRWLDQVAEAILALLARFVTKRSVRFVEVVHGRFEVLDLGKRGTPASSDGAGLQIENGAIVGHRSPQIEAALRGGRVELILHPDRFVFKPLELPSRAAEFLGGVVRTQIDRLTPWDADHAAFGFSTPIESGTDRIVVTVAAAARAMLVPILNAFTPFGVRSITIRTSAPQSPPDSPAITVMDENIARTFDLSITRRILLVLLAFAILVTATAGIAAKIIDHRLQARQDELARSIEHDRAAALLARDAPSNPRILAERALVQRKNQSPSAVIALEILSQILPDDTYVNELRIERDKVRLSGITRDAPRLIRLIEQTEHFSQATFFAAITGSPSESGDRFNIEARMEPNFSLKP